jgi:hypothetical protein
MEKYTFLHLPEQIDKNMKRQDDDRWDWSSRKVVKKDAPRLRSPGCGSITFLTLLITKVDKIRVISSGNLAAWVFFLHLFFIFLNGCKF